MQDTTNKLFDDVHLFVTDQKFGRKKLNVKSNKLLANLITVLIKSSKPTFYLREGKLPSFDDLHNKATFDARKKSYNFSMGKSLGAGCKCNLCNSWIVDSDYYIITSYIKKYNGSLSFDEKCTISIMKFSEELLFKYRSYQLFLLKQTPIYKELIPDIVYDIFKLMCF